MKFAVCIPNYNYERFVVPAVRSAVTQGVDVEVVVRDNASTDGSVAAVKALGLKNVSVQTNQCNVGYANNLDRTVRMSSAEAVVVLCADDLFRDGYLKAVSALWKSLGGEGWKSTIVSTSNDVIDPDDRITGAWGVNPSLWRPSDRDASLEAAVGAPVYRVRADELLKRCLLTMSNPFNMSTTAYPRALYDAVEGYGGGRTFNPDKWFHWRLLGAAEEAFFIDKPLGASRWHPNNQTAQQAASGALKYLVDDYVSTFEVDAKLLSKAGLDRAEFEKRFVEYDIVRHGLATLAAGNRGKAARTATFGQAVFPQHALRNSRWWALKALLATGPVGEVVARAGYAWWRSRQGEDKSRTP